MMVFVQSRGVAVLRHGRSMYLRFEADGTWIQDVVIEGSLVMMRANEEVFVYEVIGLHRSQCRQVRSCTYVDKRVVCTLHWLLKESQRTLRSVEA
jgi:hypothetical protein